MKIFLSFIFFFLLFNIPVYASVDQVPGLITLTDNIVDTSIWAVSTLLVLLIIWLGIQFLMNMDNPSGRSQVRTKAICAFIGLFIILSSRSLSSWISAILPH